MVTSKQVQVDPYFGSLAAMRSYQSSADSSPQRLGFLVHRNGDRWKDLNYALPNIYVRALQMRTVRIEDRIHLLILKNGPIHNFGDHIEGQVNALSVYFDCEVWAPGSISVKKRNSANGSYVRIIRTREQAGLIARIPYLLRLMARAVALRFTSRRVCVLVQDPLKGGLVGVIAKWLSGGSLLVEINGAYVDERTYADHLDHSAVQKKIKQIKKLSSFVLCRADGVRALYETQMYGLGPVPRCAQFRTFFDFAQTSRFKDLGETPTVLFVGYPFYLKGVDLLIQAFEKVCVNFPSWRLQLIGHDLRGEAKKFIHTDRVDVMKAVSNQVLVDYVGKCGIFVLPSRSEAMGRVLLEAGAAGKARLASNVGGIHTVIENGLDGLLFNSEDVEDLAVKLASLMASKALRDQLGERAKARVNSEFSSLNYARKVNEWIVSSMQR